MTRSADATVRWPGASIAPISRIWAFRQVGAAKQHGEGMEYGYNRVRQGEHRLAFFQEGPASLPCSYDLSNFCAKSS